MFYGITPKRRIETARRYMANEYLPTCFDTIYPSGLCRVVEEP